MRLSLAEKASLVGPFDYILLKTIYSLRDKNEFVSFNSLKRKLDIKDDEELKISLMKLSELRLIFKNPTDLSFRLTFSGLDILGIKLLFVNKILNRLAEIVGIGKESVVYYGYDFNDNKIIVKFHRVGTDSYKKVKFRKSLEKKSWLSITVENAKREYEALTCLSNEGGYVPKPLGVEYNAVAMEYIDGIELYKVPVNNLDLNLDEILEKILQTMRIAYTICNITHGDLSPYNVLIDKNGNPYLIDWPQATKSEERLEKDLSNLIMFFRKYGIDIDIRKIFDYVRGVS
ncbi:MAG: RIO1 family regulatory kinase/ATPase [Saccharolobus sp.]|uniref:non-specific serine/threonine protein kinase n=1 Tax=Saccharolobus shibatae TaxID=2286 RepID=A0A8F5GUY5_9CREN|nr:RIO1 family regulatory kinase/ATPase [Saccharolobus shibatae]MCH4814388.1 AarF/UbiB family protein [Saccharolobus shibatae]QXJ30479.1 Serine/threonine-protein kinase RIO2 [Saccharolobus shibatae]QXJ33526.1 Serine/threonine-protein kinase RIO2 [Saccharolobus shibatae]